MNHVSLKILHAGKYYPPVRGGMETVLADLCAGTAARWRVRAVVANRGARTLQEYHDGVELIRVASLGMFGPVPICPTLAFHLWREKGDCVILHEPNALAALLLLLWTRARHMVIWHHSDPLRPRWALRPYSWIQKRLYEKAARVIVASPAMATHSVVVRHAKRVSVIPYGIALVRFLAPTAEQQRSADDLRARYPGPRILFVGRLVYYKGLEVLLGAMSKSPGTLLLIGDGPLGRSLRGTAAALGVSSRTVFLPGVSEDELVSYYHAADMFVLASTERTEAFGVVQIEAMASGLPVISTALQTGVPWVNQDGITGLVVPPKDIDALAFAIRRLLDDPSLRTQMGEAARRRAVDVFSRERMIADFEAVINEVVREGDSETPGREHAVECLIPVHDPESGEAADGIERNARPVFEREHPRKAGTKSLSNQPERVNRGEVMVP